MDNHHANLNWKYFGRTAGGPLIFEIIRFPDNGKDLDHQDWCQYPEWLQPNGSWIYYPGDLTISNEFLKGDFDESIDRLTIHEVNELYSLWTSTKWPGRQRLQT